MTARREGQDYRTATWRWCRACHDYRIACAEMLSTGGNQ